MPILALGGSSRVGNSLKTTMDALAETVVRGEIEDCGHYVMEEQQEVVSRMLLDFFEAADDS